jgi:hypothetical protein
MIFRIFEIFLGFFSVVCQKVAEFGHPGSTEKLGFLRIFRILEDFQDFLRKLPKI